MTSAIPDAVLAAVGAMLQAALMLAAAPLLKTVIKKMKAQAAEPAGSAAACRATTIWRSCCGRNPSDPRRRPGSTSPVRACTSPRRLPRRRWCRWSFAAAPLEAAGGILLLVGTLALGRFALATAALDTGSPFGGMGASRDMTIAALAEPALMLGLFTSALAAGSMNLGVLVRYARCTQGLTLHPGDSSPSPASSSSSSPRPDAFRSTIRPRTSS